MRVRLRVKRELSLKEQEQIILQEGEKTTEESYYWIGGVKRCWIIWNLYNPSDLIFEGSGYCIHHKNEIKIDDRAENLEKMANGEHTILHMTGKKYMLGRKASEKTRKKMSEIHSGEKHFMFGKHHSEETRKKISISNMGKNVGENSGRAQTTEKVVLKIREFYDLGERICDLARSFVITEPTVADIVKRRTWRHV